MALEDGLVMVPVGEALRTALSEPARGARHDATEAHGGSEAPDVLSTARPNTAVLSTARPNAAVLRGSRTGARA